MGKRKTRGKKPAKKTGVKKSAKKTSDKKIQTKFPAPLHEDKIIISREPAFATRHPMCGEVAHFYSVPGQLNLVLHGVPFHLIRDQFVRFHAVQSTMVGWKFTIIYTVFLVSAIANSILFANRFVDYVAWAFVFAISVHAIINLYLSFKTRRCQEASLPILTDAARRIAE